METTDAKADTFNLLVAVVVVVIELTSFSHELLTQFRVGLDGSIEGYHGGNQGKEGKNSTEYLHLSVDDLFDFSFIFQQSKIVRKRNIFMRPQKRYFILFVAV